MRRATADDRVARTSRFGSPPPLFVRRAENGAGRAGRERQVVSPVRGRAVLVIGGLGFIGRRLVETLTEHGADVTVMTLSRERHRDTVIAQEARGVRIVEGDVRDRSALE